MITISIISPQKSMNVINQAISGQDFGCIFLKYVYTRLEEIDPVHSSELCYPLSGDPLKQDLYRFSDTGK